MFTCSDDKRIAKLDCINNNEGLNSPVTYYEGHTKAVNKIAINGDKLWSASRDLSIKQVSL